MATASDRVAELGRVRWRMPISMSARPGLLQGVERADRAEVEEGQSAIVEQPHVAGMRVGVEPRRPAS